MRIISADILARKEAINHCFRHVPPGHFDLVGKLAVPTPLPVCIEPENSVHQVFKPEPSPPFNPRHPVRSAAERLVTGTTESGVK